MVGKLFVIRRGALDDIGGFASLVDVLGEGRQIARRLAELGERVVVLPFVCASLASGRTLAEVGAILSLDRRRPSAAPRAPRPTRCSSRRSFHRASRSRPTRTAGRRCRWAG
jgi:hypothetical protein